MRMRIIATALALTACAAALGYQAETPAVKTGAPPPQATVSSRDALIARAKSLELSGVYYGPRSRRRRRECRILHQSLRRACKGGKTGDRSHQQGRAHNAAERRHAHRQVPG